MLLLLVTLGCGARADGNFAGLTAFEASDGSYRVHYLAPPWEVDEARTRRTEVHLFIESNSERFGAGSTAPPKYELDVDVFSGEPRSRAARVASRAPREDEVVGPREVFTDEGVAGWETLVWDVSERRFERHVFFELGRRTLRMVFHANPDLDDPEIDDMIANVEMGPFDEP